MSTTVLRTFVNLVKASTSCCKGQPVFNRNDVVRFFYTYAFNARGIGRSDAVGALRDILHNQDDLFDNLALRRMCRFFLSYASRSISNRAIRSIFWGFGIRLRNVQTDESPDYLDFLHNQEAAQHIVETRTRVDDTYRAALIVLIAGWKNDRVTTERMNDYLYRHADVCVWILGLHSFARFNIFWDAPAAILDNERVIFTSFETRNYDNAFRNASLRIRSDRSIAIRAIQKSASSFIYLSEELRDDFELAKMAIAIKGDVIEWASRRLQRTKDLVELSKVARFPFIHPGFDVEHENDDEDAAIMAIQFGEADVLEQVSERLQHSRDFVLAAVDADGASLRYALPEFQDDWAIVMTAVSKIGSSGEVEVLEYASERLQDDRQIVEKAVETLGTNIGDASPRFRDDEAIVEKAMNNTEDAFVHISERLRDDRRIAEKAIQEDASLVQYASERLRDDMLLMEKVIEEKGWLFFCASERLRDDQRFVEKAIEKDPENLCSASERLKDDQGIVEMAIQRNAMALRYASDRLIDNQRIVEMAIQQNANALRYASERLRDNQHIVEMAIQQDSDALRFASRRLQVLLQSAT